MIDLRIYMFRNQQRQTLALVWKTMKGLGLAAGFWFVFLRKAGKRVHYTPLYINISILKKCKNCYFFFMQGFTLNLRVPHELNLNFYVFHTNCTWQIRFLLLYLYLSSFKWSIRVVVILPYCLWGDISSILI